MLSTRAVDYGLRGLTHLARNNGNGRTTIAKICDEEDIPKSFAVKIFQLLTRAGILDAVRGPGGGYTLRRAPDEIPMREVVEGIEGPIVLHEGALTGDASACPGHHVWMEAQQQVLETLDGVTIADLANGNGKSRKHKTRRRAKRS
jgi:Rrf2 family iron-sulfur cluster assembly transcriptional regulator